jgi:hypothetical protein
MAIQYSRVSETADAIATVANDTEKLLTKIHGILEFNSDISIDWAHANTKTFTADATANTGTSTAHGFLNGQKVRVSTTGVLPVPLVDGVDYWLVGVAANTWQFAASKGGAAIDLTSAGTGTHTLAPQPEYFDQESNGNLGGKVFSRQDIANAIGSLDWIRKLLTNQVMTGSQGDHLGNLNKLARAERE